MDRKRNTFVFLMFLVKSQEMIHMNNADGCACCVPFMACAIASDRTRICVRAAWCCRPSLCLFTIIISADWRLPIWINKLKYKHIEHSSETDYNNNNQNLLNWNASSHNPQTHSIIKCDFPNERKKKDRSLGLCVWCGIWTRAHNLTTDIDISILKKKI